MISRTNLGRKIVNPQLPFQTVEQLRSASLTERRTLNTNMHANAHRRAPLHFLQRCHLATLPVIACQPGLARLSPAGPSPTWLLRNKEGAAANPKSWLRNQRRERKKKIVTRLRPPTKTPKASLHARFRRDGMRDDPRV